MPPGTPSSATLPKEPLSGEGYVVGLDVGGTALKAVIVGPDGSIVRRWREPTAAREGPGAVLEQVLAVLAGLRSDLAGSGQGAEVTAVGIAAPGWVDEKRGLVRLAVNLGWRDLEVARLVTSRLGLGARLGHDVRCGGVAEGSLGAARGARDFLFVPIGTGIASALSLGGQQRSGVSGLAGEIGHLVAEPGGPRCRCGGEGCLEAVASAAAIARRYRERVPGPPIEASEVRTLAEQGDGDAAEVWASAASYLGQALAAAQSVLDLELIVIGGGLARAGAPLLGLLEAAMSARLPGQGWPRLPRLALAELGDEAGCLGAALLARSQ